MPPEKGGREGDDPLGRLGGDPKTPPTLAQIAQGAVDRGEEGEGLQRPAKVDPELMARLEVARPLQVIARGPGVGGDLDPQI